MLRQVAARFLDLLYPPTCMHCGRLGAPWCDLCAEKLSAAPNAGLQRWITSAVRAVASDSYDGLARDAVRAFKFERAIGLTGTLARRIADTLMTVGVTADVIVPVPSHAERIRWRGYDHTALLAGALAGFSGVPAAQLLERVLWHGPQVGRDAAERHAAVHGAFVFAGLDVPRSVVLLDDVITTGATMTACIDTLTQAGVTSIVCAAVCFA